MSVPYLPLEAWNKHWKVDGSRVRCRLCHHVQDLSQEIKQRIFSLFGSWFDEACAISADLSLGFLYVRSLKDAMSERPLR